MDVKKMARPHDLKSEVAGVVADPLLPGHGGYRVPRDPFAGSKLRNSREGMLLDQRLDGLGSLPFGDIFNKK